MHVLRELGGVLPPFRLAVNPAARRQGIGSQRLGASIRWMAAHGARSVVALSWISRQASTVGLFVRAGFRARPTVEEFYLKASTHDGWTCPVCAGPARRSPTGPY